MHQNDNGRGNIANYVSEKTLDLVEKLIGINQGKDITDVQATVNDDGDEYIIIGFIYAKQECIAYIDTNTLVAEIYADNGCQHTGEGVITKSEMDEHLVGFIAVNDLVKYLEAVPSLEDYLTTNESGVVY